MHVMHGTSRLTIALLCAALLYSPSAHARSENNDALLEAFWITTSYGFLISGAIVVFGGLTVGVVAGMSTTVGNREREKRQRKKATARYLHENRACTADALVLPNPCARDLATLGGVPTTRRAAFTTALHHQRAPLMKLLREESPESDARFADHVVELAWSLQSPAR